MRVHMACAVLSATLAFAACSTTTSSETSQNTVSSSAETENATTTIENPITTSDYAYSYNPNPATKTTSEANPAEKLSIDSNNAVFASPIKDNSLKPWYFNDQPEQVFTIDNTQDQTVVGKNGVKVFFPAGCLATNNPAQPVTIKLKEYTRLVDMLLANISTTSNGELIETGGTVDVTAFDSEGNKLELKQASEIQLSFPTAKPLPGMQTFIGDRSADGSVNWQVAGGAKTSSITNSNIQKIDSRFIRFSPDTLKAENFSIIYNAGNNDATTKFTNSFVEEFKNNLFISDKLMSYVKTYYFNISIKLRPSVGTYNYTINRHILDDKEYKRKNIKLINTERRKIKKELRSIVNTTFKKLPHITNSSDIDLDFKVNINKTNVSFDERKVIKGVNKYYINNAEVSEKEYYESAKKLMANDATYYMIYASKLGMINCDRFRAEPNKIDYAIDVVPNSNRKVNIIFTDINAIISANPLYNSYIVNGIPRGKKVKVLVMEMRGDKQYYAIVNTLIGNPISDINLKPYSVESIEKDLASL